MINILSAELTQVDDMSWNVDIQVQGMNIHSGDHMHQVLGYARMLVLNSLDRFAYLVENGTSCTKEYASDVASVHTVISVEQVR